MSNDERLTRTINAVLDLIRQMKPDDVLEADYTYTLWWNLGESLVADHGFERLSLVRALVAD